MQESVGVKEVTLEDACGSLLRQVQGGRGTAAQHIRLLQCPWQCVSKGWSEYTSSSRLRSGKDSRSPSFTNGMVGETIEGAASVFRTLVVVGMAKFSG